MNDTATAESPRVAPRPITTRIVGFRQMQALDFLWANKSATVHQVTDHINVAESAKGRPRLAYTTVLTILRNLARRGIVTQAKSSNRHHVFTPIEQRDGFMRLLSVELCDTFYGGCYKTLMKYTEVCQ